MNTTTRRIIGLDPGLRTTGFGVIEIHGSRHAYIASGGISTSGDGLPARLGIIARDVMHIVQEYQPNEACVEQVFVNVNPKSTLLLGQARGATITALVLAGLPVYEYTANQIKQSVVGHGKARKEQVQHMVQRLLALPSPPAPDAADALACAICHAHSTTGVGKAVLATPQRRRRSGRMLI